MLRCRGCRRELLDDAACDGERRKLRPDALEYAVVVTFGLSYTCNTGSSATNLTITAGPGANPSGATFDKRNMKAGGSDNLNYWLYPPGYTVTPHSSANVWGDGGRGA